MKGGKVDYNKQVIQILGIFGSKGDFFFNITRKILREGISNYISFALIIVSLIVIPRQFLSQLDLSTTQTFNIYEVMKVVIICKNKNCIIATFKIMTLNLKGLNNG